MGRLTKRHGKHAVQIGGETRRHDEAWLKLAHYEDLEEAGRLIELPCAVGEIVWIARDGVPVQESIFFRESDILCLVEDGYIFGTTKEEAEAKLKELEGDKE